MIAYAIEKMMVGAVRIATSWNHLADGQRAEVIVILDVMTLDDPLEMMLQRVTGV